MTAFADLDALAPLISERILGSLAAGTLLALLVWIALRLMRGQNSRTRFALCFTALIATFVLPFAGWWKSEAAASGAARPFLSLPEAWAVWFFLAWAIVAAFGLARLAYGLFRLHQLRGTCSDIQYELDDPRILSTLAELQARRRVTLCASHAVRVPAAIGLWKPAIVLPTWCLRDLSPDELHAVVLHELEHLRRYDDWTNLLERVVAAFLFFHPAVWWLQSRLSLEREMACDDAVLAQVPEPTRYAKCLVTLAEKSGLRRGVALAHAAVSRVRQLSARIAQILDARRSRSTRIWAPVFSVAVVAAAAGGAFMNLTPRLIAFQRAPALLAQSSAPSGAIDRSYGPPEHTDALPGLRAVPARLTVTAPSRFSHRSAAKPAKAVTDSARSANAAADPVALNAALRNPTLRDTTLAETQTPSAEMLVLVVHTEERDSAGNVWNVQVVRWVIFHPQPTRILEPVTPSKT